MCASNPILRALGVRPDPHRTGRQTVNNRVHRETGKAPFSMLDIERTRLHPLPVEPHTLALGESRQVLRDQTVRFGSVRYSTPPGLVGQEAFVRVDGDELVVVVDLARLVRRPEWMQGPAGLAEVARHQIALPGRPVIGPAHYPGHPQDMDGSPRPPRPKPADDEAAFLALGPGAKSWLIEAAAAGTTRMGPVARPGRATGPIRRQWSGDKKRWRG